MISPNLPPGFHEVQTWSEAESLSNGYETSVILERNYEFAKEKFNGQCGVVPEIDLLKHYFITAMAKIIHHLPKGTVLKVLDWGGGWGKCYFWIREFFPDVAFDWTIVETESMCLKLRGFERENIRWINQIAGQKYDFVITSAAIQYIENYLDIVFELQEAAPLMFCDRIPLIRSDKDIPFLQVVPPSIYDGAHPVWGFSDANFLDNFQKRHAVVNYWKDTYDSLVFRGVRCDFFGMLSKAK